MQSITLLSVGKVKTPWIADGIDFYLSRLAPLARFERVVLRPGAPEEESARMTEAMTKREGTKIVLDETGKAMTSADLAAFVGRERDGGLPLVFAIGGAYGFSDDVRKAADLLLSLSSMTFPHELAQLVFTEQLYRAHAILAGSGYHH